MDRRDILLTLLILTLSVTWFSACGPRTMPETGGSSGWLRPGAAAEPELAAGEEIVVVFTPEEAKDAAGEPADESTPEDAMPETAAEEVTGMDLFLIGYAAGVAAVLVGVFAAIAVIWLYLRITK